MNIATTGTEMLLRHLEFEEKELTQKTPPFQAQHWKILLTMRGSLSCFLSMLWALLWARTLLALLRRCSSLFCWIRASSFEMVQIPQMESLIPLARSCRKVLTLSAISLPPKLSTTQRREKCPQISHHEGPANRWSIIKEKYLSSSYFMHFYMTTFSTYFSNRSAVDSISYIDTSKWTKWDYSWNCWNTWNQQCLNHLPTFHFYSG